MRKINIILVVLGILVLFCFLYRTYAINSLGSVSNDNYVFSLTGDTTSVKLEPGTNKTVYYKVINKNNGTLIYGIGYKSDNVIVKVYSDSDNNSIDYINKEESKFIKLYMENNSSTTDTVILTTIFGYEFGGELVIPSEYKLVTSKLNKYTGVAYKIASMFDNSTKSEFTSVNGIDYVYDENDGLIEDAYGNIRYYGASPNNYIYFNCSDYSNQSADTCELWRIIGVVDGKVKIMRNEIIGEYSWDNKNTSTGAEDDYGKNDWTTARLMKLLNPIDYYTIDSNDNGYGQGLYYYGSSGQCFSGQNNATIACDFTNIGLKNDITKNMISEFTYYLKTYESEYTDSSLYADQIYYYERYGGSLSYSNRTSTWLGKIVIPYASDYAYAVDLKNCSSKIDNYNNCSSTNWMFPICSSYYTWLLSPSDKISSNSYAVFRWRPPVQGHWANTPGTIVDSFVVYYPWGIIPTLYLDSSLEINDGTGTSSNPYRLKQKTGIQYTITYNSNGGSTSPSNQIKYENENITLSSVIPTRSGYTFAGWNTNSSGTGTNYASGATYSTDSNVTLYAKWTAVSSYSVTVYLQGEFIKTYTVVPGNDLSASFGVDSEEEIRYNTCTNGASITASLGRLNNMKVANISVTNITSDTVCNLYYSLI